MDHTRTGTVVSVNIIIRGDDYRYCRNKKQFQRVLTVLTLPAIFGANFTESADKYEINVLYRCTPSISRAGVIPHVHAAAPRGIIQFPLKRLKSAPRRNIVTRSRRQSPRSNRTFHRGDKSNAESVVSPPEKFE